MTQDERQIQDYLDGRLPAERRSAFEKRLLDEPELAREVDALRQLGVRLREGRETLGDEFFVRARRRFAGDAPPRRTTGFQWVSWEGAGLATAAVLAVAIFVPAIRQQVAGPAALTESESRIAARLESKRQRSSLDDRIPVAAPAESLERNTVAAPPEANSSSAPEMAPTPDATTSRENGPAAGSYRRIEPDPTDVPAGPNGTTRMKTEKKRAQESGGRSRNLDRSPAAPLTSKPAIQEARDLDAGVGFLDAGEIVAVRLPPGTIAARQVQVVDDTRAWQALLDGPGGEALAALGAAQPGLRLVLIGPPAVCDSLILDSTGVAVRINVDGSDGSESGGCALTVAADGRPVQVTRTPGPEHE